MQFSFVSDFPNYFNFATLSKDLLSLCRLWIFLAKQPSPEFCLRDYLGNLKISTNSDAATRRFGRAMRILQRNLSQNWRKTTCLQGSFLITRIMYTSVVKWTRIKSVFGKRKSWCHPRERKRFTKTECVQCHFKEEVLWARFFLNTVIVTPYFTLYVSTGRQY
jgi:hypothetical protein